MHEDFAPMLESVRGDLPKLRASLVVREPGSAASAESLGGADYETVVGSDRPAPAVTRSGDDLLLLYTGGTTGMPKGVMWRQHDLYLRLAGGGLIPPPPDLAALRAFVRNAPLRLSTLVAPPLMHGTGWFTADDRLADGRLGPDARRSQALRPGGPVGRGRRARSPPRSRSSAIPSPSRWSGS